MHSIFASTYLGRFAISLWRISGFVFLADSVVSEVCPGFTAADVQYTVSSLGNEFKNSTGGSLGFKKSQTERMGFVSAAWILFYTVFPPTWPGDWEVRPGLGRRLDFGYLEGRSGLGRRADLSCGGRVPFGGNPKVSRGLVCSLGDS